MPDYVAARASVTIASLEHAASERARVAAGHEASAARSSERARALRDEYESSAVRLATTLRRLRECERAHERYAALALAAHTQASALRFDLARARESDGGWRWKLITVSPAWNPSDERAYSVDGLSERARDAWARWERVRVRYSAGGLAASVASIELSDAGHVHVHALVYGPWIEHTHACEIAGCHVDVRSIEPRAERAPLPANEGAERIARGRARSLDPREPLRAAVKEACKYIVKVPSALRSEWIAGRSVRAIHPALAAAWVLAMRGQKAARSYGPARDAITCERLQSAPPSERVERVEHCRCCGSLSLSDPHHEWTQDIARVLGLAWGPTLRTQRRKPPD